MRAEGVGGKERKGIAGARQRLSRGQPCQLVQAFRYVSRERWAPVLRIPCPFLGAVRLADLPCVLGSAARRSAYRCRFRWFCSWGNAGACGSRSLHSRRYQRAHEAGAPGHASQCVAIVAQDDGQAQPCWHSLPRSAVFSARAPQIKQRKAAAAKQDAGQQQDRPEAGRHKIAFQACMQRAIPVHETDRMQAGEYP